ncbi:MAG TPA: M1 family aminopeptidase [Terriglobales bacterium]|nr:M1 family aminopeptidase [Terriglobales bacterium]
MVIATINKKRGSERWVRVTNADSINNHWPILWALWFPRIACLALYFGVAISAFAQQETAVQSQTAARTAGTATADLYRQLGHLSLDSAAVYKVRDGAIDREDLHISLTDGTIAFTREVNGRITGALFEGEGEILIVPPDYTERHSLSMFSKSAVLNERFSLAYFRFVDDAILETLNRSLRPPEGAADFIQKHNALAQTLSEADSLRTLIGLTYANKSSRTQYAGEFLYTRLAGEKLGSFEVFFDPMLEEQISVRQVAFTPHGRYYDLWTSFPMQSARRAQGQGPPPPSQIVEITDYKIRMDVRPPTDLSGTATLTLRTYQSGPRALLFELSRYLRLSSVELESPGRPPVNLDFIQNEAIEGSQLSRRGNDTVTVVFPQPFVNGEALQLRFNYAGSVMSEAGGGLLYVGARGTWYPNRGPAMSNFDLTFRHPAEWKLLATGNRVSSITKDGADESRFVSDHPVPLAGFNLGKYVSTSVPLADTKLDVYSSRGIEADFDRPRPPLPSPLPSRNPNRPPVLPLPSDPAPNPSQKAAMVGKKAAEMIEFLSPRIGAFPYSSLSLTQLPGPNSQGWPGLVFLSSYVFLDKEARERSRFGAVDMYDWVFDHLMTEHEVAHQWWGNNVFWKSYRDQWLMEALSNYCSLLKLEREDPALFRKLLEQYRKDLLLKPAIGDDRPYVEAGPVRLGVRLNSSRFSGAYDPVVYGRGTWLMHMLREMLKDSAATTRSTASKSAPNLKSPDPDALFFAALRDLQTRFAGKKIDTRDFLAAFEKVLPAATSFEKRRSLDWFYDGWINGSAVPTIELDNVRITSAAGRTSATGLILQKDAPELLVTSIPIYALAANGSSTLAGRIFADGERTEFKLSVPSGTKKLLLDPEFTILRQP